MCLFKTNKHGSIHQQISREQLNYNIAAINNILESFNGTSSSALDQSVVPLTAHTPTAAVNQLYRSAADRLTLASANAGLSDVVDIADPSFFGVQNSHGPRSVASLARELFKIMGGANLYLEIGTGAEFFIEPGRI